MSKWVEDFQGNRCSVEYWGTRAIAQAVLGTLKNCTNCTDCIYCTNCTDCAYCLNIENRTGAKQERGR